MLQQALGETRPAPGPAAAAIGDDHLAADPQPAAVGVEQRGDLRAGGIVVLALAGLGAVLGLVWAAWSPPGPRALVLPHGLLQADETEAWIAADGRFLVLTAVAGLLAGGLAWSYTRRRGPLMPAALAAGGLAGAALTALVGHLTGGGTTQGRVDTVMAGLPLSLHMHGLLLLEGAVAVLVYGLLAAFTARDDLGRPDHEREARLAARRPGRGDIGSVGAGAQPDHGGGHGDAPRPLQQRDLPPQ